MRKPPQGDAQRARVGALHQISGSVRRHVHEAGSAFATNFRSRELRLAQLAFGAGWGSEAAFTIALSIVAFRDGGAARVGLVALLRVLPSAIVGPAAATLADRYRRDVILAWIGISRAVLIGSSGALLAANASPVFVYILAVAATAVLTPFRASHSALLPGLCHDPEELASAMAARGLLDSLSTLMGPLAIAALLAVSGPAAAFAAVAAASTASALAMLRLRYDVPPRTGGTRAGAGLWTQTAAGIRTIVNTSHVGLLTTMAAAQAFTRGCLNVFTVVVAIELLRIGDSGVGVLNAAVGVGAVAGSLAAATLVGSRRLGGWFALGIAMWGAPLALTGAFPQRAPTLALLAGIGAANAVVDVSFFTLVGRLVDDQLLARVFGVLESIFIVAVGVGSVVTPAAIAAIGTRGALVMLGTICPAIAVLAWGRLWALDRMLAVRSREIQLLREVPMLRVLPAVTIEQLARAVRHTTVAPGECLCQQGEHGDTFYVIESGAAEVLRNGGLIQTFGPGDHFGEIALLRDVPRTATVRARTEMHTTELTRDVFIPLISGYRASAQAAEAEIGERLAELPAGTLSGS
jgi:hypothetical protein